MQAEAGQVLKAIVARKELERRSGDGLFFWGVGNAPSRAIASIAEREGEVDVVFSQMKSRPQARDATPTGILAWRTYFDSNGVEHPLPPHVLVTSRMEACSDTKSIHYALMCRCDEELRLDDHGSFDPLAYRNVGDSGGAVGSSQVTALVVRSHPESQVSGYRINLRAKLTGSYWVRLGRPRALDVAARAALTVASARAGEMECDEWIELVARLVAIDPSPIERQLNLF